MKKLILGAAIGNCVHVAGVLHFLQLAEREGYEIEFLGPAIPIDFLSKNIKRLNPAIVAISYRLTAENVVPLLEEIVRRNELLENKPRWEFGGTKPVAEVARRYGIFEYISDGYDDSKESIRYLRGGSAIQQMRHYGKHLTERIEAQYPYPILRHHFGRSNLDETVEGVKKIAQAGVLDVISLGPDQNAQQFFFRQTAMRSEYDGAGGVPIRKKEDLIRLKHASMCGNFPLMRCYSGTEDVFKYAELLISSIDNAWAAIPLCWYNELDGRGSRTLGVSIREAHELIKWHAVRQIPVEINEPHHWGLRDAHDVIPVAMAYISAYTAKQLGVKTYIAQYMFNNPSGMSFSMDFARVLAMLEMVESLRDDGFKIYRETRTGLPLFHVNGNIAKGQLAASTFMQMSIKPHIVHVVGYCEADHAASADEVIESCEIVKGVMRHALDDEFSIASAPKIIERKNELIREAKVLLHFIENHYDSYQTPWSNPEVLADCIQNGYLDAVHIKKNEKFRGTLSTRIVDGKCVAYDPKRNRILNEKERLCALMKNK